MSTKIERITPILDAVEKAGGLNMAESFFKYSPAFKELSSKERSKATFSIWAFLFTIFYYIYHGMWKKGLTLLAAVIVIQIISSFTIELIFPAFTSVAWVITSVIYSTRAPINLYSTYRLNDDSWNPIKDLQK
tara:strand:- start:1989 stop:2387 length:399 start_codon:yes stop_codon:yes gene_type:complete